MKRYISYIILLVGFTTTSCSDFLDVEPKDLQTTTTAFQTYENFKTFAWGLYSEISISGWPSNSTDLCADLLVSNVSNNNNNWAVQGINENTDIGNWEFSYIRRCNVMLTNIESSKMTDVEKKHWRSVALFFRALRYYKLLNMYGDVPWLETEVQESDEDVLYGPRTPRDEVASNILRDLKWAEENIKEAGDGTNTINKKVVQALSSRFCLFEGTWRKYHGLQNGDSYLKECVEVSKRLMTAIPKISPKYDMLFNQEDLSGEASVILAQNRKENTDVYAYRNRGIRSSNYKEELTHRAVEMYLCTDGKTISNSPLYCGDKTPFEEFRNRDHRLWINVCPPYRIYMAANRTLEWRFYKVGEKMQIGGVDHVVTAQDSVTWREYYDQLTKISSSGHKEIPMTFWNNGSAIPYMPRMSNFSEGNGVGAGQHGYWFWKFYNTTPAYQAYDSQAFPFFRIEETMLNYAEAKAELGTFTQDDADLTINKLRARVDVAVAPMTVNEIDDAFDPKRDADVSPILWEIRRERAVELLAEEFRWKDLRRWHKCDYLELQQYGMWMDNAVYGNKQKIKGYNSVSESKNKSGYVVYRITPKKFLDHYYLYPLPIKQLVLNPQLTQNPGYKDASSE